MDTKPTPGEITIMAAGAVALIFSFFAFLKSPVDGVDSISAWGKGLFPVSTLMVIFLVLMALQIALTKFANVNLPDRIAGFTWLQIHLVLGAVSALYAVAFLIRNDGGYDKGIGFWFILAACIAALVGAILLSKERAGGSSTPPPPTA